MRYSELCFNTKRNQDPDKAWIPGIPACHIIHELMRKLDLTSYLEVHSMKDAEKYMAMYGEKTDIIYVDTYDTGENLFYVINACKNILGKDGFILVDRLFPYYQEFDNHE